MTLSFWSQGLHHYKLSVVRVLFVAAFPNRFFCLWSRIVWVVPGVVDDVTSLRLCCFAFLLITAFLPAEPKSPLVGESRSNHACSFAHKHLTIWIWVDPSWKGVDEGDRLCLCCDVFVSKLWSGPDQSIHTFFLVCYIFYLLLVSILYY